MSIWAIIASVFVLATIAVGCRAILQICRGNEKLNRDQRNGYTINRSAPTWLEGDK